VSPDKIDIVLVAQLLRIGWLVPNQTQSRDPAAFLVDRDNRLAFTETTQIIDQLAQLRRAFDVAPEQDETARLYAPKQFHGFGVEFFTGNAREDELTE
jgi:hypothetical protein